MVRILYHMCILVNMEEAHLFGELSFVFSCICSLLPFALLSSSLPPPCSAGSKFEKQLVVKLREVMMHEDLEEVTSRQLRLKLEEETGMELKDYREFLDRHMLRILGQMEQPSQILDYLYLVRGRGVYMCGYVQYVHVRMHVCHCVCARACTLCVYVWMQNACMLTFAYIHVCLITCRCVLDLYLLLMHVRQGDNFIQMVLWREYSTKC